MNEEEKIRHLARRATFGPSIRTQLKSSLAQEIDSILNSNTSYEEIFLPDEERVTTSELVSMTPELRKEVLNGLASNIKKLNLEWIKLMGKSQGQLREKIALFWHGHFAVRVRGIGAVESYVNTIRKYALSNFGDLLMAVSKEPAMLNFLNNTQNKKNSPNENFAREVMELFTLGRGNYTEKDIKEAARAFTGWGIGKDEEFELKVRLHDFGEKTIFGKTGNWDGEDVIRMILERKETALHICRRMYRFFVSHDINEAHVEELADYFYAQKYDIPSVMRKLFESPWFYEQAVVGNQIKSPVELIVGLNRAFGISYENSEPLLAIQRVLGQTLFFPPNVAGWAGGRNWIDNSSIITRMRFPQLLSDAGGFELRLKDMDDENPNESLKETKGLSFRCSFHWEMFVAQFEQVPNEKLWEALCAHLLANNRIPPRPEDIHPNQLNTRPELIRQMAMYLVRLPDYQLT